MKLRKRNKTEPTILCSLKILLEHVKYGWKNFVETLHFIKYYLYKAADSKLGLQSYEFKETVLYKAFCMK